MIESIRTSTGRVSVSTSMIDTIMVTQSVHGLKGATMQIDLSCEEAGILLNALHRAMEVIEARRAEG